MPPALHGNPKSTVTNIPDTDKFKYDYINNLDLRPGKKLHDDIVKKVMDRAIEAHTAISNRFPSWNKIDRTRTAYVEPDEYEKAVKKSDDRKPVSLSIPISFATEEAILTYLVSVFLGEEFLFRYEGFDPTDMEGGMLLTLVIQQQMKNFINSLPLHTFFKDGISYNLGNIVPVFKRKFGAKILSDGENRYLAKDQILFEGNKFINVDPYNVLADPSVPGANPNAGEYWGWLEDTNRMELLREEQLSPESMFNARYLQFSSGSRFSFDNSARGDKTNTQKQREESDSVHPVVRINMFVDLIPKEWEIGDSEYPEKWYMSVGNDNILLNLEPIELAHGDFPVVSCAPDTDGYSAFSPSRLEIIYPMQEAIDWLISSHFTNIRKAINDMLIVDPLMINMDDLMRPEAGKIVRLNKAYWGRGVGNAVEQLKINDATRGNVQDTMVMVDLFKQISSAVDPTLGIMRSSGERRSATEAGNAEKGARGRMAKIAKMVSDQSMLPLARFCAIHTQQLMSQNIFVRLMGEWGSELKFEYGSKREVNLNDILVDFDIICKDGSMPDDSSMNTNAWTNLYAMLLKNPAVANQFDMIRIFMHIAKGLGAKDVGRFRNFNAVPLSLEDMERSVGVGDLASIEDVNNAVGVG